MNFSFNLSGTWKALTPSVNIAGTWHSMAGCFVNVAGVWKQFWSDVRVILTVLNTTPPAGYTFGAELNIGVVNGTASSYVWSITSGTGTIVSGQGTNTVEIGYNNGSDQPTVQCVTTVNGNQYTNSQFL